MAGQISRHMANGWLGELFMSLALMAAGVGILAVSARIQVPFYPVPVTMQTLAVMVIAMACQRLNGMTLFSYLMAGLGAPVFAGGAGFAILQNEPTGGYLAGFLASGVVLGALADGGRHATGKLRCGNDCWHKHYLSAGGCLAEPANWF